MTAAQFWFHFKGRNHGPLTLAEARDLADTGEIDGDSWAWAEGLESWRPAREVPGLEQLWQLPRPLSEAPTLAEAEARPRDAVADPATEPHPAEPHPDDAQRAASQQTEPLGQRDGPAIADTALRDRVGTRFAGLHLRAVAGLIDALLLSVLAIGSMQLSGDLERLRGGESFGWMLYPWWVNLLFLLYFLIFFSRLGGGQSFGYRAMHLRMVDQTTLRPASLPRLVLWYIGTFILPVGWLWYFADRRRRMLHNIVSRTVVLCIAEES